jgi:thiamine biosynthesis protein ThiI
MKGILLLSSGIDSPVAGYLMIKKGVEIVALHFDNSPMIDSRAMESSKKLAKKLGEIAGKKIKMYIVNHGRNQIMISKNIDCKYQCILCKRMMFRIAEKIALKEKADFIITGDSLGQVASQTLQNMAVIENIVNIPVLRPVLCNDKQETIDIAKQIGTFDISIQVSSCCAAVPPNPATKSKSCIIESQEANLNIEEMAEKALENAEVLEI